MASQPTRRAHVYVALFSTCRLVADGMVLSLSLHLSAVARFVMRVHMQLTIFAEVTRRYGYGAVTAHRLVYVSVLSQDLQDSGANLAVILSAGEWKGRAVATYLDIGELERDVALEAAMLSDDEGDA